MKTKFFLFNLSFIILSFLLLVLINLGNAQDNRIDTYDGREFNAPFLDGNQKGSFNYGFDSKQFNNPVSESLTPEEGFESGTFPPTGWTRYSIWGSGAQSWIRQVATTTMSGGAYGLSLACARFDAFNLAANNAQALESPTFTATVGGEVLRFDWAYVAWTTTARDSLTIQTSPDGSTWTTLAIFWGDSTAANYSNPEDLVTGTKGSSSITDAQWARKILSLPVGTTKIRFIGHSQFGNSIYIDNIITYVPSGSPLTGVFTINFANPTSGSNFQTFRDAADALNLRGISGPVTFNVAPGLYGNNNRFVLNPIAGSSSSNTITFQKSGAGKVILSDTGSVSPNDYLIMVSGADWITFDGIDLRDGSFSTNGQINRGYYLNAYRGMDGPKHITVKNAEIVLGGALAPPGASIGVVGTGMIGGTTYPAIQEGSCDTIKIQNVRVNKSDRGIGFFIPLLSPTAATAWHRDVEISNCVLGDSISIGSRTAPNVIGFIPQGVKSLNMFNNRIDSLGNYLVSSTGSVTGIACQLTTGRVYRNTLRNLTSSNPTSTTPVVTGIQAGPNNGEDLYIYNNLLFNFSKGYTGAANATVGLVGINPTNFISGATSTTINHIYNNTVIFDAPAPVTFTSAVVSMFAANLPVDVRNNCFINKISTSNVTAKSFGIADPNTLRTLLNSNYNDIFVNGTNGFTGAFGTGLATTNLTIADWKAGSTGDTNSVSGDVAYITLIPLNIDANNSGNWVLNGKGHALAIVTTDINGAPRNTLVSQGTTDIGANEFNMSVNPSFATESAPPSAGGTSIYTQFGDTVCIITWGTGGTLPSGLNVMNMTGDTPPNSGSSHHLASYMNVAQVGGPISGTFYNMKMKFGFNQLFNITNTADMRLAKQNGTFWTSYLSEGTGSGQSQLNVGGRSITVNELNSFSNFTATDINLPLSTQSLSPTLLLPANNSITVPPDQPQVFVWSKSAEIVPRPGTTKSNQTDNTITAYHLEVYTDTNSAPLFQDSTLTDTTYTHNPNLVALTDHWWRVRAKNENGWGPFAAFFKFKTDQASGLISGNTIPTVYDLFQNYPNPFNPSTSIKFDIPFAGFVSLKVYDITGKEVANLVNGVLQPSSYSVNWNGSQFSSGVYFYRLQAGDFVKVQKMILTK